MAGGPIIFDAVYFESVREWHAPYQQHNAALKWFRIMQEGEDPVAARPLVFNNFERVAVADIQKGKGMEFDFDETRTVWWFWLDMVAQMDQPSIRLVCHGPDGRSRGLVRCEFSQRPNSYDHQRHYQRMMGGHHAVGDPQLRAWDFVLIRDDGSGIRVHPQWSKTKILTYDVEGHAEEVEIPQAGLGKSDGRGTYKLYRNLGAGDALRFDASKRPQR